MLDHYRPLPESVPREALEWAVQGCQCTAVRSEIGFEGAVGNGVGTGGGEYCSSGLICAAVCKTAILREFTMSTQNIQSNYNTTSPSLL
jgi:hypothetical protein